MVAGTWATAVVILLPRLAAGGRESRVGLAQSETFEFKIENANISDVSWPGGAEDAECFCFRNSDFDGEKEADSWLTRRHKKTFERCAGMKGAKSRCNELCEEEGKYKVLMQGEPGVQTVSHCKDDGTCRCLDIQDSIRKAGFAYAKKENYKLTEDVRIQGISLAKCYSECPAVCMQHGFEKGGCIWPIREP
eukprot:TRINITY_DN57286_c0_g1_i1.p1 TRINITY_DN57286_c0_g1~~TRINITY_DN57286_c0_g1_i1.p1  ORF type:complete len:192 (+),score=27.75 TRINITY_DN57286_c0_g1_i1:52-627(+)